MKKILLVLALACIPLLAQDQKIPESACADAQHCPAVDKISVASHLQELDDANKKIAELQKQLQHMTAIATAYREQNTACNDNFVVSIVSSAEAKQAPPKVEDKK